MIGKVGRLETVGIAVEVDDSEPALELELASTLPRRPKSTAEAGAGSGAVKAAPTAAAEEVDPNVPDPVPILACPIALQSRAAQATDLQQASSSPARAVASSWSFVPARDHDAVVRQEGGRL